MSDETMLEEIERLQATVGAMWRAREASGAPAETLSLTDREVADEAHVDLDTVRAFLVSEDGRGIGLTADDGVLAVTSVEAGYGG